MSFLRKLNIFDVEVYPKTALRNEIILSFIFIFAFALLGNEMYKEKMLKNEIKQQESYFNMYNTISADNYEASIYYKELIDLSLKNNNKGLNRVVYLTIDSERVGLYIPLDISSITKLSITLENKLSKDMSIFDLYKISSYSYNLLESDYKMKGIKNPFE